MITWLRMLPSWAWWLLAVALVVGLQQLRVASLQAERTALSDTLATRTTERDNCRTAWASLEQQVAAQNQALAALKKAEQQRQARAQQAQAAAREQAEQDYQAANRLQQDRTGGDACTAAEAVIDLELGL